MESVVTGATGNQRGLSTTGLQSGRELVVADPSSNTVRNLHERLEQEKLEQERQERLEQERLELEQERLEQERLEQVRLEQVRLEQVRLEHERLEQERLELLRIEERLERDEVQERLAQALQVQGNLEQEKQNQQQREKQEQERQEEERRRQETREKGRREQEKSLKDSERTGKRHTQIDMESLVSGRATENQDGLSAASHAQGRQQTRTDGHNAGSETTDLNLQSGRELVVADPSSNTRNPQTLVNNEASGRQVCRPSTLDLSMLTSTGFDSAG